MVNKTAKLYLNCQECGKPLPKKRNRQRKYCDDSCARKVQFKSWWKKNREKLNEKRRLKTGRGRLQGFLSTFFSDNEDCKEKEINSFILKRYFNQTYGRWEISIHKKDVKPSPT